MKLSNQFASLGNQFSGFSNPEKPEQPITLLWNEGLANELGLDLNDEQKAAYFSGQLPIPGSTPIAMAYSGHQFGHFNPQLGDGRAHLLGEIIDSKGVQQDIQLKGSGQTPYSRNGDGKCGIKPAVREYIMSEAMHALGVPTTRCLAVVTTGETIYRQATTPGAVVTRIASSHIRVGTFEYFAARGMHEEINTLTDLTIQRHFPEITQQKNSKYINFLSHVIDKQINLITEWMRVGFIHGVMNTDNTLLSGQTIDYGPCAMMGVYDPATVFSSIDHNGRYAFGNQAQIAQWNMARLVECLLALIDEDEKQAIKLVTPLIESFSEKYNHAFNAMMAHKLGFEQASNEVNDLQQSLLKIMYQSSLDYTETFVQLQEALTAVNHNENQTNIHINSHLNDWFHSWFELLNQSKITCNEAHELMKLNNPLVIPRNHHIEKVLDEIETTTDIQPIQHFQAVLNSPYSLQEHTHLFQDTSSEQDLNYQTYCGT